MAKTATALPKKNLSQSDVPAYSLDDALRLPQAIADSFASRDATPLRLAQALDLTPNSSKFRMLCGASIAYGLTEGGAFAETITLLPLGKRIVNPQEEGDDLAAKREALLQPRVMGDFLKKYDGSPVPREDIAQSILTEMGVPRDKCPEVLLSIIESAESVGFLTEIKGKKYVDLSGVKASAQAPSSDKDDTGLKPAIDESASQTELPQTAVALVETQRKKRVFIAHGKNTSLIEPIKKLLSFGELEAVVSTEKQSVAQPVPDKVLSDMRSCGASIIHVDDESSVITKDAEPQTILNPNVLIEIGASMALYGHRFILLVKDGIKLPTNLQGLYEVRYQGESLTGEATIRLLEAINDIKNHPLPSTG